MKVELSDFRLAEVDQYLDDEDTTPDLRELLIDLRSEILLMREANPPPVEFHRNVLDDIGFVRLVEYAGHGDFGSAGAGVIEAARQSTQGKHRGWERESRLARYLWEHRHGTPFEFCWLVFEVRAPIFVFRQWHRHRIQSYNEVSARYGPLPCEFYVPSTERLMSGALPGANKQANGTGAVLTKGAARAFRAGLIRDNTMYRRRYESALASGVPKELARLGGPVNQYSQMRVAANLRAWMHFLGLRDDPHAQWEIQQYAAAIRDAIRKAFPEIWEATMGASQ